MQPRGTACAWLLALVAACGDVDLPSGEIACGAGDSCPRDMTCGGDGLCYAGAAPGDGGTSDDGAAGGDGGSPCAGGRLEDFADDFDDLAAWELVGGSLDTCSVQVNGGLLVISTSEPGDCGVETKALYQLTDQSAAIRIADGNLNAGNPDLVFRAVIAGRTLQLVLYDGAMTAMNCPDTGGCGTSGIPGGIRDWWRLRHDPVQVAVYAELSSTGVGYPDGVRLDLGDDDATCVRLFIGSSGQVTGDLMYPIDIESLNIP